MIRMQRAMLLLALAGAAAAAGEPDDGALRIATWGGSYEASQRNAYFVPFTEKTGVPIYTAAYSGGVEALRRRVQADTGSWDLADMTMADHQRACRLGYLQRFDHRVLAPAPDGTPARRDFLEGSLTRCGVAHNVFSMVVAYDKRAFPGVRPHRIGDLFRPEQFPGVRALRKRPDALLEWALVSYGVPPADVYTLLSTERGMRLAFERLDRIRDDIAWWRDPEAAIELLDEERVTFASGYNGRFFNAQVVNGRPFEIIWDAQLYQLEVWGILANAPRPEVARDFVRFATRTESLERQTRYIAYGPTRTSAIRRVGEHVTTGVGMAIHMPTHPSHMDRAIEKDVAWYSSTRETLSERFDAWLARGGEGTGEP
ncbi:MAG: extracellular solute-binding protein [Halofilum sp. (in: g-proteobacteria)]|nr:extracellular solute-binding protein [Halofilum sp. (in: g-proteobacteria)]